ncbi:MAG: WbqC family protein [Bacteroidales bacterium]|nr:WbqC family protein [Candidatus Hennigimonas equi]
MEVLSIAYFPPVSYFSLLLRGEILLEANENYQKQSWRNRCNILTANGVEALQVPVVHCGGTFRHPIREIMVDYSRDWLTRQKRAMDSAYMSSAYFEYYRDGLYAVLDEKPESLWELDIAVINFFLSAYGKPKVGERGGDGRIAVGLTDGFAASCLDIHPKREDAVWNALSRDGANKMGKPYFQVFSPKYGFVPNLSIMDYLFNEGPGL